MIPKKKRCCLWGTFAPAPPTTLVHFAGVCTGSKADRETHLHLAQGSEPMKWKKNCKEKRKGPGDFTQKQIILVTLFLWNLPLPESSFSICRDMPG